MLFYTLQRLGCSKHEDSRGTVVLAALDGCAVQVGRESLATAPLGRPSNHSPGRSRRSQEQCWPFLSTLQFHKDPERLHVPIRVLRQDARRRKMGKQQAIPSPSLFLCAHVPCPQGITWCSRTIRGPSDRPRFESALCPSKQASFLFCPQCGCESACSTIKGFLLKKMRVLHVRSFYGDIVVCLAHMARIPLVGTVQRSGVFLGPELAVP